MHLNYVLFNYEKKQLSSLSVRRSLSEGVSFKESFMTPHLLTQAQQTNSIHDSLGVYLTEREESYIDIC